MHDRVGRIRRLRRIRHGKRALCYQSGASKCWPDLFLREDYDAQNAAGGSTFSDGNDRSRRLPVQRTPRDDVIVSPQTAAGEGRKRNLVITPDGNVMYNGKQYSLNAAQREQAKDYQAELRSTLPWIDEGAKSRVEKARIALDKIIVQEMGESSKMRSRLTKLDAQLKEQMNRIIETRSDGLTFHYKAIDQVRAEGQQLVNQAMGGILQDSINEMGAKAVLKSGGNPLQNVLGSLGGLQSSIQTEWKKQEKDFQQFGKDVCSRVVTLEDSRKALVGNLK